MKFSRYIIRFLYKNVIKKFLFIIPPDKAHSILVSFARIYQSLPILPLITKFILTHRNNNRLKQNICGINFSNPVGLSAGFDKNIELIPTMSMVGFGYVTGGSITITPRAGNPRPWFYRLPKSKSIVVHAGLANDGANIILQNIKRQYKKEANRKIPLFISIAVVARSQDSTEADIIKDVCEAMSLVSGSGLAKAVEINISCPNIDDNQPFTYPDKLDNLLSQLDKISADMPIFIKMPNLVDFVRFGLILEIISKHKINGVTISNLVKDRSNISLKDKLPESVKGGLSGKPCRDRSLDLIKFTYEKYEDRLLIIGVGGIFNAEDAYLKIRAGSSLVALITGLMFEGPQLVGDINHGLDKLLKRDGFSSLTEAIGIDVKKSKKNIKKSIAK